MTENQLPDPAEWEAAEPERRFDPASMFEQIEGDLLEQMSYSGEALARRLFGPPRKKEN
jgi:hypothetical protein